jgi:hypothetical protein
MFHIKKKNKKTGESINKYRKKYILKMYFFLYLYNIDYISILSFLQTMQKCIVIIYQKNMPFHDYEIKAFINISMKNEIRLIIFSETLSPQNLFFKEKFKKIGIFLQEYTDLESLSNKIQKLQTIYDILYIDTLTESLIQQSCTLKKSLKIPVTPQYSLFQNKSEQRILLEKYYKKPEVISKASKIQELSFVNIKKDIWIPCIIKPPIWIESSWVALVYNKIDLEKYKEDFSHQTFCLVEEYIDGSMHSIDYFVDEKQNIYTSPPIEMYLAQNLEINDFFVYCCKVFKNMQSEIPSWKLRTFITDTVKACCIKNSFIHHEFKQTTKWELKTIEINGRIWGRRLKILREAYGIELYNLLTQKKDLLNINKTHNFAAFAIYPPQPWILINYNYKLLEQIRALPSFLSLKIFPERYKNQKIWLTRYGFWNIGMIYLKNINNEQFAEDYHFIEKNYKNLLFLR